MTTAPLPVTRLRAVTRAVDAPDDLLDAFGPDGNAWLRNGAGFVTAGVVAEVAAPDAAALLASIDHDDELGVPGTGPIVVGALPFVGQDNGRLVVPQRIVGRTDDGIGWVTDLGRSVHPSPTTPRPPTDFAVYHHTTRADWQRSVCDALDAIGSGALEKVVLARRVDIDADQVFDVRAVLACLRAEQPACFVYAARGMVGATPELLVRRRGRMVESRPMAGTAIGSDDAAVAMLRRSEKDRREHRPVVDSIEAALAPWCEAIGVPREPELVRLASLAHFVSPVRGRLVDPPPDACALMAALHPTPAVAGTPRDAALAAIARLEPDGRGRYAGPVGWMDARGDGEWGVALRGAEIDGHRATLHAGAGIVAGSDPQAEWRETDAKLEPMLRALVRRQTA